MSWHPEWWVLATSVTAWCLMLEPHPLAGGNGAVRCALCRQSGGIVQDLADWLIMILAMMLPLIIIPARAAAFGSLWRRRHLAMAEFLAGYVAVWMLFGGPVLLLSATLHSLTANEFRWVAGAGFFLTAVWQSTNLKRRFSAACHQTIPLAPDGWAAHRDCLRFGALQGAYCVGSCGLLMLLAMLSPWPQTMILAAMGFLLYERYHMRPRNNAIVLALGLVGVAHWVSVLKLA